MFSKTNKTKKNFIGAIAMSLVLLMGSALGFLLETGIGQIVKPSSGSWSSYTSAPTGSGTSADPYKVKTARELAWFLNNGSNSYVVLESDIDLAGHTWSGILSNKVMNFDGKGHTISNLTGTNGLMGNSGSYPNISNVVMVNVNISGSSTVGGIAGNGNITNCIVKSGTVRGNSYIGGIVGSGTPTNCTNNATVIGAGERVGGIVGYNGGTTNKNMNTGNVFGTTYVGGIGGLCEYVTNCYAECSVTGSINVGGVLGVLGGGGNTLMNSGFKGKLMINGSSPTDIGSLIGYTTSSSIYQFKNNFAVAEIQLLNSTDTSVVHQFGAETSAIANLSNVESSYSYSQVYTSSGITEYRKYKVGSSETTPFSDFAYDQHINGGYPFYRPLFAVGQFIECDTMSYLEEYGFGQFVVDVRKEGSNYYVDLGEYPKTYVGETLNATLEDLYENLSSWKVEKVYTNGSSRNHNAYKYGNDIYVRVASATLYTNCYWPTFSDGTSLERGSAYWFKIEPITWRVLNYEDAVKGSDLMLISEDALTAGLSSSSYWGSSPIRTWLNDTFYNDAFSDSEKGLIKATTVQYNNGSLTDSSSNTTSDKVWLLSYGEAFGELETKYANKSYFFSDSERICVPNDYAFANGCSNTVNMNITPPPACSWQTRTWYGGVYQVLAGSTGADYNGNDRGGIRPVIKVG